jgi:hypothetical protein
MSNGKSINRLLLMHFSILTKYMTDDFKPARHTTGMANAEAESPHTLGDLRW